MDAMDATVYLVLRVRSPEDEWEGGGVPLAVFADADEALAFVHQTGARALRANNRRVFSREALSLLAAGVLVDAPERPRSWFPYIRILPMSIARSADDVPQNRNEPMRVIPVNTAKRQMLLAL